MNESQPFIRVCSKTQSLNLYHHDKLLQTYLISTAKNGLGETENSEKTPRGWHEIADKIGEGAQSNAVFVSRELTGEIYSPALRQQFPDRDWILTRILRLRGLEKGRNQGPGIDSYDRYIYIHGTPDENEMGELGSRGCVRMRNSDIIDLFERVEVGTQIYIE